MLASWCCGLVGGATTVTPGFRIDGLFCPYYIENFVPPLSVSEAWVNKQLFLIITAGLQLSSSFQGASGHQAPPS